MRLAGRSPRCPPSARKTRAVPVTTFNIAAPSAICTISSPSERRYQALSPEKKFVGEDAAVAVGR
jgi:hypothetical protein